MKNFSRIKRMTGVLTLFGLLLLPVASMAAELSVSSQTVQEEIGPGIPKKAEAVQLPEAAEPAARHVKGESLGNFSVTAYCPCRKCSGGNSLTYSGTVPKADHTISADLSVFPVGTKVMIDDIVYTVEDKGSGVNGNKADIFFSTHEEALAYGRKTKEVFLVSEP